MGVAYYHKDKVNSKTHLHIDLAEYITKAPKQIWIILKCYHKKKKI